MKAYDINGLRLRIGDEVIRVKPSVLEYSEDLICCIVGSIHKIDDIIKSERSGKVAIELGCHPYKSKYYNAISADPRRFIKVIK